MKKRVLALLLTLVMLVSCFPMNLIAKTSSSIAGTADGPLSLTARESKSGFATGREGKGSTANTHHGKLNTDRFELSSPLLRKRCRRIVESRRRGDIHSCFEVRLIAWKLLCKGNFRKNRGSQVSGVETNQGD